MDSTDKLQKAKVKLILSEPFFATLALQFQYQSDHSVKTATINGKTLRYNPEYFEGLTVDKIKSTLAHEVMHVALLHHTRRERRDSKLWNQATDYAINPLLIKAGFTLPENHLIDTAYENLSAEQIYNLLQDKQQGNQENNSDNTDSDSSGSNQDYGGIGDVTDLPPGTDVQQAEAEMKQALAQAALIASRQGKLPVGLDRLITEILQPKIRWQEVLARFITEITKNDYTWTKPSLRYLHSGLYLPSLEKEEIGNVILIIDTSSSINETLINQFGSEAQDITSTFHIGLRIIYVDTKVQDVQHIEPDEPILLKPKGGGGTDFRPGFNYIENHELLPKAVVYLTDGECNNFPGPPDYPVLWAQYGKAKFTPPFGETIRVD